jgi:hypothetical protein
MRLIILAAVASVVLCLISIRVAPSCRDLGHGYDIRVGAVMKLAGC